MMLPILFLMSFSSETVLAKAPAAPKNAKSSIGITEISVIEKVASNGRKSAPNSIGIDDISVIEKKNGGPGQQKNNIGIGEVSIIERKVKAQQPKKK